jgi:hypothetical protein
MHKSVLANPVTMGAVIQAVQPHVAVDDGLTSGALAALGAELNGVRSEDVTFFTVPTTGTGTSADGQSIVNLDWAALPGVQEAFRVDTMETGRPTESGGRGSRIRAPYLYGGPGPLRQHAALTAHTANPCSAVCR